MEIKKGTIIKKINKPKLAKIFNHEIIADET